MAEVSYKRSGGGQRIRKLKEFLENYLNSDEDVNMPSFST
jgi:hypothetical protein